MAWATRKTWYRVETDDCEGYGATMEAASMPPCSKISTSNKKSLGYPWNIKKPDHIKLTVFRLPPHKKTNQTTGPIFGGRLL